MGEAEILEVYDLAGNYLRDESRNVFYERTRKHPDREILEKVELIHALVMTSEGRLHLQRRASTKYDNPDLLDKTVGGHIVKGKTPIETLIQESLEELAMPTVVAPNINAYRFMLAATDLAKQCVVRQLPAIETFESIVKTADGSMFIQPYRVYPFIGYYDGAFHFADSEVSSSEVINIERWHALLGDRRQQFTQDLVDLVGRYASFLRPVEDILHPRAMLE